MNLETFNSGLLATAGLTVNDDNEIQYMFKEELHTLTIGGKTVKFLNDETMEKYNGDTEYLFHPSCESIVRDESPILNRYRTIVNSRLNSLTMGMVLALFGIAANVETHKKLNPNQTKFLEFFTEMGGAVDKKTSAKLKAVSSALSPTNVKRKIINIFIKKDGVINKERYLRKATAVFPLFTELVANGESVFGVKDLRNADKAALKAVLIYLFPDIETTDSYSAGSNSKQAPNLESYFDSISKLFSRINEVAILFSDVSEGMGEFITDLSAAEGFEYIKKYKAQVPSFDGNVGTVSDAEAETAATNLAVVNKSNAHGLTSAENTTITNQANQSTGNKPAAKMSWMDSVAQSNPMLANAFASYAEPAHVPGPGGALIPNPKLVEKELGYLNQAMQALGYTAMGYAYESLDERTRLHVQHTANNIKQREMQMNNPMNNQMINPGMFDPAVAQQIALLQTQLNQIEYAYKTGQFNQLNDQQKQQLMLRSQQLRDGIQNLQTNGSLNQMGGNNLMGMNMGNMSMGMNNNMPMVMNNNMMNMGMVPGQSNIAPNQAWMNSGNQATSVDTPGRMRAKQNEMLYNSLLHMQRG